MELDGANSLSAKELSAPFIDWGNPESNSAYFLGGGLINSPVCSETTPKLTTKTKATTPRKPAVKLLISNSPNMKPKNCMNVPQSPN